MHVVGGDTLVGSLMNVGLKAVTVDDIALLYTDFQGTTVDASGAIVEVGHEAIEVLRLRPDGTWQLIVGDPNGRE